MKEKMFNVYWAASPGDWVKITTVKAKQRRTAEKMVRQMEGADIIIDSITEAAEWNYTMELIKNNID